MRTPNSSCCICGKPLYRRPYELAQIRYVACMEHRGIAQTKMGSTDAQLKALELGREPGTNHRTGYKHREESKKKASDSHKRWCKENPEKVKERSLKTRGPNNYNWKGGSSRLNLAIRGMYENRKWSDGVRSRDCKCVSCGSPELLEAHHIVNLSELILKYDIKNTEDARKCEELWNLDNGVTLCMRCHYKEHGRRYPDTGSV